MNLSFLSCEFTLCFFTATLAAHDFLSKLCCSNVECSIACLKSLQKLLSSNLNTYRDVFREVGILEMLIKCLQRWVAYCFASFFFCIQNFKSGIDPTFVKMVKLVRNKCLVCCLLTLVAVSVSQFSI